MKKMKANVFHGEHDIRVEEVERPRAGIGDAVIRVTLTTICGTDLHILRGEYPVKPGLIIGHEPVGVIEELGAGVSGYAIGDRVLVGRSHCGRCRACLWPLITVRTRCALRRTAAGDWATLSTARRLNTFGAKRRRTWQRFPMSCRTSRWYCSRTSHQPPRCRIKQHCIGEPCCRVRAGSTPRATAYAKLMARPQSSRRWHYAGSQWPAKGADIVLDYREVDVVAEVQRQQAGAPM